MPIYEFYCGDCHTVFSFFAAQVGTDRRPACPRCERPQLEKRPSRFAMVRASSGEEPEDDLSTPFDHLDEAQLERAMGALASELDGAGENEDPRTLGRAFRRFGKLTGLELGPRMEDAIRRLERGEDLESVESDLEAGDEPESEDDFSEFFRLKKALRSARRPRIDETLYFL